MDPGVYLFIYSPADLRIQLVFADFSVGKKREKGYHPFCSFENEVPYQSLKSELMCRVVDLAHEFEKKKSANIKQDHVEPFTISPLQIYALVVIHVCTFK